ncbi:MAG: hypothetical protein ACYCOR_00220 [Acidobacteriaceae bacterium]
MPKGPFDACQFVATEWSSAADKATFGNTYLRFIESEWKQTLFTKSFYDRLSNCFGHIAHYNVSQFYETWFTCDKDRLEFLKQTATWPCYGDPKFTFSDVERAIQKEIRHRNYVAIYELRAAQELRSAEMAVLGRLEAKYRSPAVFPETASSESEATPETLPAPFAPASILSEPVQISLF